MYRHTFHVVLTQTIESPIADFDDAIDHWAFRESDEDIRRTLLDCPISTTELVKEVEWTDTEHFYPDYSD